MSSLIERYSYIFSPFIKTSYRSDEAIFRTALTKAWFAIFSFVVLICPFFLDDYSVYFLSTIGVATLAVMGLNILLGYSGLVSLGHASFVGVGAYSCGILINSWSWPFYLAILGAGAVCAFWGLIIGIPALRIKGLYLAIATLAFQFIASYTFLTWESVTGGITGITIPSPRIGGWELRSHQSFYYIMIIFLSVFLWIARNLFRSKFGRALMAIRDNDISAEVAGMPVFRYKILAFAISSFYAGLAGGLYGIMMRQAAPDQFGLDSSINYLAMIIVGGMGTILGAILGAAVLLVLPELLTWILSIIAHLFPNPNDIIVLFSPAKMIALGLMIVIFIHYEITGLAGIWRRIRDYLKIWPLPYT